MHITYRLEKNLTHIPINTDGKTPTAIMHLIDQRISELRKEEKAIRDICVKLSGFLKSNSITPFNDDMIEYLNHFLNEEKLKQTANGGNQDVIRDLERSIEEYTRELDLFSRSIQRDTTEEFIDPKKIEAIFDLVAELYKLPINGKSIESQVERIRGARQVCVPEH